MSLSSRPEWVHAANWVNMREKRTRSVVMLAVLVACGFDAGGVGSGTASVGGDETSGAQSSDSTTLTTSASADSSAGAEMTSPTDPSDSVDSTVTAVDTGTDTTTTTTADDSSTTTGGTPMVHHLASTDQSNCDQPLWCFTGDVWTEHGDPIYGQQCFTSPIAPPFELISVHYVVADVAPELDNFFIEVHSRDDAGPTDLLFSELKAAIDATPGSHEHVFEPAVQIDDSEFCVGFATPYEGLAGALGMAVDVGSSVSDVSFIRLEGPTGCVIALWSDVIDDQDPTPSGNWCIDVQIREMP